MHALRRRIALACLALAAAGCSARSEAAGEARPEASRIPTVNACVDPVYLEMRRVPVDLLDESQKRRLADMENACIDYRLALARARGGGDGVMTPLGADYRSEVLPWLLGISFFTGGLYLFAFGI